MNLTRKSIALATTLLVLTTLGTAAFAKIFPTNENSGTVHLETAVRVGSTQLSPGDYKVSWTGPSDNAQVTLKQNQTTATVTARVVEARNNTDSYSTKSDNGARVLTEIQFHKVTL
ncbi:MAG TPA: hypothetical protein VMT56_03280, partial [Candidatus Bathyarchaeia archaeon]|nr:hypothetical protein [Candidatus Bathyarchaeia archaeon]